MIDSDKKQFADLLKSVGTYYDKDITAKLPIYWEGLKHFEFAVIAEAINQHTSSEGVFMPKIADIINHIPTGRLSADEAWAIAVKSASEDSTVPMTDEIAQSWGMCSDIYRDGDKSGARMAFRASYDRICAGNRGKPVKWFVSQGHDAEGRAPAIKELLEQGLISNGVADTLLLEERTEGGANLERLVFHGKEPDSKMSATGKAELAKIRKMLTG